MATKIQVEVEKQQSVAALKEIKKGIEEVGAAASNTAAETAKVGGGGPGGGIGAGAEAAASGFGKVALAVGGVIAAITLAKAAANAFGSAVKTAGEGGNAEARRLTDSVGGIGKAWDDATNRIMSGELARGIMEQVREAIKGVDHLTRAIGFLVGGDDGGAGEKRNRQLTQNEQLGKINADAERQRFAEAERHAAAEVKTIEEVNQKIDEQTQKIFEQIRAGTFEGEAVQRAAKAREIWEDRKQRIDRDQEEAAKRATREQLREQEKAADGRAKAVAESDRFLMDARQDAVDEQREIDDELRRETAEKDQRLVDELKQQEQKSLKEREKAFRDAAHARENVAKGTSDEEIKKLDAVADAAEQTYDRAATAAEQAASRRIQAERAVAADAERRRQQEVDRIQGTDGINQQAQDILKKASDPKEIARNLADKAAADATKGAMEGDNFITSKEKAAIAEARQKAYRQAMLQLQGRGPTGRGPGGAENAAMFNQEDFAGAVKQNADQIVTGMSQQGDLSRNTVEALSNATNELSRVSGDTAMLNQEVEIIKKHIGLVSQQNTKNRQQAQRRSATP